MGFGCQNKFCFEFLQDEARRVSGNLELKFDSIDCIEQTSVRSCKFKDSVFPESDIEIDKLANMIVRRLSRGDL